MAKEFTQFDYTRNWFNFCFENPDRVKPIHTALYCWLVELNNRMGWADKFASPTSQSMQAIGINSYNSHKKAFDDLVDFGFITVVQESRNQFQCTILALNKFDKARDKALDKALIKQDTKHHTKHSKYNKTNNQETNKPNTSITLTLFEQFWNAYAKKVDQKKCITAWNKLTEQQMQEILQKVPAYVQATPDVQFRKNPLSWLNGQCWLDVIAQPTPTPPRQKYIPQPRDFANDEEYLDYCKKEGLIPVLNLPQQHAGTLHNI